MGDMDEMDLVFKEALTAERSDAPRSGAGVRARLRKIILLTSSIEPDGAVWGMDTEVGKIDDILDEAYKIIKPVLGSGGGEG